MQLNVGGGPLNTSQVILVGRLEVTQASSRGEGGRGEGGMGGQHNYVV